jgi:hypothetical protein
VLFEFFQLSLHLIGFVGKDLKFHLDIECRIVSAIVGYWKNLSARNAAPHNADLLSEVLKTQFTAAFAPLDPTFCRFLLRQFCLNVAKSESLNRGLMSLSSAPVSFLEAQNFGELSMRRRREWQSLSE